MVYTHQTRHNTMCLDITRYVGGWVSTMCLGITRYVCVWVSPGMWVWVWVCWVGVGGACGGVHMCITYVLSQMCMFVCACVFFLLYTSLYCCCFPCCSCVQPPQHSLCIHTPLLYTPTHHHHTSPPHTPTTHHTTHPNSMASSPVVQVTSPSPPAGNASCHTYTQSHSQPL